MKDTQEQLKKLKNIRLSKMEREHLRAELIKKTFLPSSHPFFSYFTLSPYVTMKFTSRTRMHIMRVVAVILVILIASGGTLTYASESALPGDLLYPVKIHVAEEIDYELAPTPIAKAEVQKERIETRLSELKTLQSTGQLTPSKTQQVTAAFVDHAQELNQTISTLQAEGNKTAVINVTQEIIPVLTAFKQADIEASTTESTTSNNAIPVTNSSSISPEVSSSTTLITSSSTISLSSTSSQDSSSVDSSVSPIASTTSTSVSVNASTTEPTSTPSLTSPNSLSASVTNGNQSAAQLLTAINIEVTTIQNQAQETASTVVAAPSGANPGPQSNPNTSSSTSSDQNSSTATASTSTSVPIQDSSTSFIETDSSVTESSSTGGIPSIDVSSSEQSQNSTSNSSSSISMVSTLAANSLQSTSSTGIVEGTILIQPSACGIKNQMNTPCTSVSLPYPKIQLLVYSADHSTLIARIPIQTNGSFSASLVDGTYTLDILNIGIYKSSNLPESITVTTNKTLELSPILITVNH